MSCAACARLQAIGLVMAAAACRPPGMTSTASRTATPTVAVDAARELDQQGIRSFRDGRYADATAYFRESYRLGGPSSELWNIVRCRERLDDAEGAAAVVDEYLARRDLAPPDRAEAQREAQALRERPSVLTVTTAPPGAAVLVDGRPAPGATPLSTELRPGPHAIVARRDGYAPESRTVEARFGHAVIISLDLSRAGK